MKYALRFFAAQSNYILLLKNIDEYRFLLLWKSLMIQQQSLSVCIVHITLNVFTIHPDNLSKAWCVLKFYVERIKKGVFFLLWWEKCYWNSRWIIATATCISEGVFVQQPISARTPVFIFTWNNNEQCFGMFLSFVNAI